MPTPKLVKIPADWTDSVSKHCLSETRPGKRAQILALQRALFARAMKNGATTAEVNACAKTFALLEDKLIYGKPDGVRPDGVLARPRTAGLKSKLLSSVVQPTSASGQDEVEKQPDTQSSQATDDTSEA